MRLDTENIKLPENVRTFIEKEIERVEMEFTPSTEIRVYIDIGGDHIYHLKSEVISDGRIHHTVNLQNHDLIKAFVELTHSLQKLKHVRTKN